MKAFEFAVIGLAAVLIACLVVALQSAAFMLLWNWLAVDLFGAKTITFWQALGILALIEVLLYPFKRVVIADKNRRT
jgi:hypothetical protein